ncbi:MAG: PQQ-dependent sugar dehydrogenase, partial [Planctomycetes bacterium]|nr:PQQ-dependent sugar dehydrogenase [Planctomycetota bacterium]
MKAFQLSLTTVIACSIVVAEDPSGPLSPAESLRRLEPAGGLEISLFAQEPMVVNPTNIDIDERGRVWVAEGVDYRRHADLRPEGDRIVILEDTNGDGTADRSKTYYQDPSIKSPLGIGVFGRRVVVSCSPHVFLFIDEDGDDIPDEKRVLFSGIEGVQHDHGVHAFVFQPDGKLYFNFGNNGNRLLDGSGSPVVDAAGNVVSGGGTPYRQGMIFRCDLDGGNVETLGHNFRNNYEVTVDSFGTLWQSDNDDDGNRSTRINFVMEFGNYGYRDELTGASWKAHRTGAATDVPLRHFHQNDPGVVPNLLQTGAGSPTGICVYEGELLPKRFRGQLIHCDAGPNVVRSYPVKKAGAGYTAQNLQFVKGYDRWFRPSDVCVAADGSVFIADWYDAGVGGHQMADNVPGQIRGRIYRVAPSGHRRVIPPFSVETADGATEALKSPNRARWFRAWQTLSVLEEAAEEQLLDLWKGDNPRWRARALQFLARMPRLGTHYLRKGLSDPDEDIRVTSLRIVRSLGKDVVEVVRQLVRDPSAAVRRECAIALRGQRSPDAASLWAELAAQHDGQDRWYVEALGIGAAGQDDRFFAAWLQKVGDGWDSPAGRDVVWRVRAVAAASLLGRILRNPSTPEERRPRYLRAFDFLSGPAKEAALETLLESEDEFVAAQALLRMTNLDPARNAEHKAIVDRLLERSRGTGQFVDLVRRFEVDDRADDVFDVVLQHSTDSAGAAAVRWLLDHGGESLIERATEGDDDEKAFKVIQALGNAN